MRIKGTEKFKELGIDRSYQGLETEIYFALKRGEIVKIKKIPEHLKTSKFIEIIKSAKADKKKEG